MADFKEVTRRKLDILQAAYCSCSYPSWQIVDQLAKATGLSTRVIVVWFQNKRGKERRLKDLMSKRPYSQLLQDAVRMRIEIPISKDAATQTDPVKKELSILPVFRTLLTFILRLFLCKGGDDEKMNVNVKSTEPPKDAIFIV